MEKVNLDSPGKSDAVTKQVLTDIDSYCVKTYDGGHRAHLGGSQIGEECQRKLWYIFRWCYKEKFDGRMMRLFNRGHREEPRFLEWLEGIGAKVWADDLDRNILWFNSKTDCYALTNKTITLEPHDFVNVKNDKKHIQRAKSDGLEFPQYRISAVGGHFGGSLDGQCLLPDSYNIEGKVLLEFKTSSLNAYKKMEREGVAISKPVHFAQMCTYGVKYGLKHALYMFICKDNDKIYVEIVKLNAALGEQMLIKAERIIKSQTPPARISENETLLVCKWCEFSEICHRDVITEVNCRSCANAHPALNAEWWCEAHEDIIPKEYIPKTCPSYKAIARIA